LLSRDPAQEYFTDGMTEELIAQLTKIAALRVISRTSVMHYKGTSKTIPVIARELSVDGVIEGSVLRSGNRVRITAQLIQGDSDKHLWAESYERDLNDVFGLQSEVAGAISNQVKVTLTPQEKALLSAVHAINPEAHEAYLRGLNSFNQGRDLLGTERGRQPMRQAIQYFEQAIKTDPNFAMAYVGLARTYHWLASSIGPEQLYADSKTAALKALQIDDTVAEGHAALAFVLFAHEWDWGGAMREYKRAKDHSGTRPRSFGLGKKVHMPTSKELTIRIEDRPGILAKFCKTLADHRVNILAFQTFQSVPAEGKSVVRIVVDDPSGAKKALDGERISYTEAEVAQVKLPNRPGELRRAASQLGAANINIEYGYSGLDASNSPVVFFGVKDVNKAVAVLDKIASAA
jgi:TolB-like protein